MNLKSKRGKRILQNASIIGAGMFILGTGVGLSISNNTSSSVQKPSVQKQGIVEPSTKNKSSSTSTSAVSSKKDASSKLVESSSSKLDTPSSMPSSKSGSSSETHADSNRNARQADSSATSTPSSKNSSSSETHTDSNSSTQQTDSSSTSMPVTAAVGKTYTVVRGDSLWSISQLLHKSFAELLIKNPSANPDHIEDGEVINL